MPSSNVSWGIEVGAFAIKAVKLERGDGGRLNVLDFVVLPHKKVLSTPELDQNDAIRVALGQFASQVELTGATVAVSIPGHAALARFAKLPPVEPKKIPDIVKFEAVQQIPFGIDEVEWDYQTFQSPDSPDVEVGIFAVTKEKINERLTVYQDVNLVPDVVTLSPVAVYNAMALDLQFSETTPGTIVMDIGTTSTDLIIAEAGRVWIRTFPIGGHHFTEALVNAFKLSYAKAEKLKREAEQSKHARHVFQAMRPVFSDLAQEVQRSIGYYQSLHREANLTRLIGLGSTFLLPGLRKYLRQQVGIEVYRLESFKQLQLEGPRGAELTATSLNLATAYGLALQGLGMNAIRANLMPIRTVREAMWRRKVKWFGVAAGIAFAACVALFVRPFLDSQAIAGAPRSPEIQSAIGELQSLKSRASEVTGDGTADPAAANMLALLADRDIYARVVADLGSMLESADRASAGWAASQGKPDAKTVSPAYWLEDFKTTYMGPGQGEEIPFDAEVVTKPAEDAASVEDGAASTPAMIKVEMKLSTTQPDPRAFYLATLHRWLAENHERDGVPYLIRRGGYTVDDGTTVAGAAAAPGASATGRQQPPTRGGRGLDRRDERLDDPGGRGGGRGGRGQVIGDGPPVEDEDYNPGPDLSQAINTGGGGQQQQQQQRQEDPDLKRLAPLPERPPPAPEGATISTVTLTWYVQLVPPAPPAEEVK